MMMRKFGGLSISAAATRTPEQRFAAVQQYTSHKSKPALFVFILEAS
jgi:hypothetical protein